MSISVLLVDDEEQFVDVLAKRLENKGLAVHKAYNGDQCLDFIKDNDVDVIILDVLMPGKDGMQVLREVKQLKPLVEVIMLTGHATVETAIEGMKLGAHDYLMKPTDIEDLVTKIEKAYQRKAEQEERIRKAEINGIVKTKGW